MQVEREQYSVEGYGGGEHGGGERGPRLQQEHAEGVVDGGLLHDLHGVVEVLAHLLQGRDLINEVLVVLAHEKSSVHLCHEEGQRLAVVAHVSVDERTDTEDGQQVGHGDGDAGERL